MIPIATVEEAFVKADDKDPKRILITRYHEYKKEAKWKEIKDGQSRHPLLIRD